MNDSVSTPEPAPELPVAPAPRKRRWPAILWICAPFAALLAGWKFALLAPLFFGALPYTQAVAFATVGIVGLLYKDKYSHPVAARAAMIMFILFGVFMALNTYRERASAQIRDTTTAESFNGVNGRITDMQTDLTGRVDKTDKSVGKLAGDVTDLRDKVRPDELKTEMAGLRDTMHSILNPPKATIGFTFTPFFNPPPDDKRGFMALKEITRAMDANRVVTFDITAINYTPDVTATAVDLSLIICDDCTFAKEPKGFSKLQGNPEHVRYMKLGVLNGKTTTADITLDVTVPPGIGAFEVGFDYRCAACIVPKSADMGLVRISNPR